MQLSYAIFSDVIRYTSTLYLCMAAVVIGYASTAISVTEGDTATFSAEVMFGNLGDLAVRVVQSTLDGTATGISHQREFTGLFVFSQELYITVATFPVLSLLLPASFSSCLILLVCYWNVHCCGFHQLLPVVSCCIVHEVCHVELFITLVQEGWVRTMPQQGHSF